MADRNKVLARFREYMHLERQRTESSFTPAELSRWTLLKRQLDREFNPGLSKHRSDARRSVRIPTRMAVSLDSMGDLRECLMTNLSRGGLFLATEHVVEIGTRLNLILRIEGEDALEIPVEVVSHNMGATIGLHRPGMGMRFLEMRHDAQKRVDDLYERAGFAAVRDRDGAGDPGS